MSGCGFLFTHLKIMTEKQKNILKYTLGGSIVLNMFMCLNLYRQMVEVQYKISSIDNNMMSAVQSLSRTVWEIKSSSVNSTSNYSGYIE
jgi:hypothetical protein